MTKSYREVDPLLPSPLSTEKKEKKRCFLSFLISKEYKTEAFLLFSLAWPTIITSLSRFATLTISIAMCGHLGQLQLDIATLANGLIDVLGLGINLGFTAACDTLFSQSFGCGNKKKACLFLQRCFITVLPILMVTTCIFLNMESIWLLLSQDPLIAKLAAEYILLFLPAIYFDSGFLILARFMQNQGDVYPPMLCSLVANVVNAVGQYVLIYVYEYDYQASAVMQAVSFLVALLCEITYFVASKRYRGTWDGCKPREAFENLGQVYVLGLAGILMTFSGEIVYEMGTFIAGALGAVQLAAQGITFQLEVLSLMFSIGMAVAVNIRVGNQLGARNPEGAKVSYHVGMSMIMITATIMALIFIFFSGELPKFFSDDVEVIDLASSIIKILAIFQFIDGIGFVSGGALRGCGRQVIGSVMILLGFYIIALPTMLILSLGTYLQVMGIWIGLVLGVTFQAFSFLILLMQTDWPQQSTLAVRRVEGVEIEPQLPSNTSGEFTYTDMDSMSNTREDTASSTYHYHEPEGFISRSQPLPSRLEESESLTDYRQFFSRKLAESFSAPRTVSGNKSSLIMRPLLLSPRPLMERDSLPYLIFKRALLFGIALGLIGVSVWTRSLYQTDFTNICSNSTVWNGTVPSLCRNI